MLNIIKIIVFSSFLIACNKIETFIPKEDANLGDINISSGINQIVTIPESANKSIVDNFTRYTKMSSSSDLPIHIIAQNEVKDEVILRIKDIFNHYFNNDSTLSKFGEYKLLVNDKIAENKGTIAIYNSQLEKEEISNKLVDLDLNILALTSADIVFESSEDFKENNAIDHSYSKIAAFIMEFGIKDVVPSFFDELIQAADNAISNNYWFSVDLAMVGADEETRGLLYLENIIEVYYDLWAHNETGLSNNETYRFNSRDALMWGDFKGYEIVSSFFPPYIDFNIKLNIPNDTIFSLVYDKSLPYTLKSQHFSAITIEGNNNIKIIGNSYNNFIQGNNGTNIYCMNGMFEEFNITNSNGIIFIEDSVPLRNGLDKLVNIDFVQFQDTIIEL